MDTGRLEIFLRVIDRRSVSAAARDLHMTQPSVSDAILRMEREWGVALLERRGRLGVDPTDAGRVLYDRGQEIMRLVERTRRELRQVHSGERGQVTIATCLAPLHVLPALIRRFSEQHAGINVELKAGINPEVIDWVRVGVAHLGLTLAPVPTGTFHVDGFGWERFEFFAGAGHSLTHRHQPVPLAVLAGYDLVVDSAASSTTQYLKSLLRARGFTDCRYVEVGSLMALKEMVIGGVGVGFAGASAIARERQAGLLRIISAADVSALRQMVLIRPSRVPADPVVEAVAAFLLANRSRSPAAG